jgi:hypothetical protein
LSLSPHFFFFIATLQNPNLVKDKWGTEEVISGVWFREVARVEGILNVNHALTVMAQNEEGLHGGFSFYLKYLTKEQLFSKTIAVIPAHVDTSKPYEREQEVIDAVSEEYEKACALAAAKFERKKKAGKKKAGKKKATKKKATKTKEIDDEESDDEEIDEEESDEEASDLIVDRASAILLYRAQKEYEKSFCEESSLSRVTKSNVKLTDREKKTSLLDVRTNHLDHFSEDQKVDAFARLGEAYVEFGLTKHDYERKAKKIAASSRTSSAGAPLVSYSSSSSSSNKKKKSRNTKRANSALNIMSASAAALPTKSSNLEYCGGNKDENAGNDNDSDEENDNNLARETERVRLQAEYMKQFKKYTVKSKEIDWLKCFPNLREVLEQRQQQQHNGDNDDSDSDDDGDSSEDEDDKHTALSSFITPLDLLYCNPTQILKEWHNAGLFGLLPLMAISSSTNIGTVCSGK